MCRGRGIFGIFLVMAKGRVTLFHAHRRGGSHFFKLFTSNLHTPLPPVIYDQFLRSWKYYFQHFGVVFELFSIITTEKHFGEVGILNYY